MFGSMFNNSKYSNVLTVILVIAIIAIYQKHPRQKKEYIQNFQMITCEGNVNIWSWTRFLILSIIKYTNYIMGK